MRRNARWASSSATAYISGMADGSARGGLATSMGLRNTGSVGYGNGTARDGDDGAGMPLMAGFAALIVELRDCPGSSSRPPARDQG